MKYKSLLLIGAPGSGKGTQGKILGTIPGFFHFSSGELFRSVDSNSVIGKTFLEYSSKGLLVPDDITIQLFNSYIDQMISEGRFRPKVDYLVLDGLPRNVRQWHILSEKVEILFVYHLYCSDRSILVSRLKGRAVQDHRVDDTEEVIRKRFEIYERETKPLLNLFSATQLKEIDCSALPYQVLRRILEPLP
ncbi:adenylate kinase [Candidatus Methylacidiphilum fumarolicum]|uniref:Adenylate kinase n=2 Tax=Candidatus Methylacidiphilum fumarolicum TaxID=591154 RepID=I0JX06_METFB|nr:nucleoside monophosphate kinase [Candidatus Methylacidiphilum fumarolicum]TFE69497.1 adenylate kinase [Candidatus Methylacidiphilum fumarolicum]TFE77212.1 adenylate kinase [Candidatus Methylacidiphilum fumarolicum]CAI9085419.1 Adenylate kinase [Candidatus Methylacidiphilum fumarolicum]CCG91775.1 Adenylate kinase [Methylacidiphilum fumariolicum SolV]